MSKFHIITVILAKLLKVPRNTSKMLINLNLTLTTLQTFKEVRPTQAPTQRPAQQQPSQQRPAQQQPAQRAEQVEEARQPKRVRNQQTIEQVMMIMLMKMMVMVLMMMTTMTSQVKASSSGSSTGVSVREPLNVRLQRLLSSDQSSAYTILDILQVCFDRSFYLYLRMLRVFPCTCSFYLYLRMLRVFACTRSFYLYLRMVYLYLRTLRVFPCTQAPRTSQAEIIKFLRGVTARIEEEARRRVRVPF